MKHFPAIWLLCLAAGCGTVVTEEAPPATSEDEAVSEAAPAVHPPAAVAPPAEPAAPPQAAAPSRKLALPAPTPLSREETDKLREQLRSAVTVTIIGAVRKLSGSGAREAIPDIVPLLQNKEHVVQFHAITALGDLDAVGEAPKIRPFLRHQNSAVRLAAIATLIDMEDKDSAAKIAAMIEDTKQTNRWDIMKLVGMSGLPEAGPVLLKLLDDPAVQSGALMALGYMRLPEAGDRILPLLKHPKLQLSAVEAMGAIDARKYAPDIRKLIWTSDLRLVAAVALARIQDVRSMRILQEKKQYAWLNFYSAPEAARTLDTLKFPLRYVRNRTVTQVAESIAQASGLRVEFSPAVGERLRNAVFGMDVGSLGCPSCFTLLSSFGGFYLEDAPGRLEWIASPQGIRLVTVQEAEDFWKNFRMK